MNVGSPKTIIAKSLDSKYNNDKKQEILTWRNMVDETYSLYNDNLVDKQDPFGQAENDQTAVPVYEDDRNNEYKKILIQHS